jgi:hypothetical protein
VKRRTPTDRNRSRYKIGYGRPPEATQFKKGTSGNKKGRPKATKNIATLFHEVMYRRVAISENGQRRTITMIEAALKQLTNKAATGDPKAIQAMINIARELGDLKLPDPLQGPQVREIKLNIFAKDPETGQRVRVNPPNFRQVDDDEE